MKKIILFFTFLLSFIFSQNTISQDILLDRFVTKRYKTCPLGKKQRKRFFLLEIRETKYHTVIYIFEKTKVEKYKFIYGFNLSFMGKEIYFRGHQDNKTKQFKKNYFYYCTKPKSDETGNFFYLVGGKLSKKTINSIKAKKNSKTKNKIKNNFYGKNKIVFFIPENKKIKAFFTVGHPLYKKIQKKARFLNLYNFENIGIKAIKEYANWKYASLISNPVSVNGFLFSKQFDYKKRMTTLIKENKDFRDKYYFDLADLQKKGIPEPKPMWDSKVKPYKNVFGEELLD